LKIPATGSSDRKCLAAKVDKRCDKLADSVIITIITQRCRRWQ